MDTTLVHLILQDHGISYAIVDHTFKIIEIGGAAHVFSAAWLGRSLLVAIPELMGCEAALADILDGRLPRFQIDRINRPGPDSRTYYLTLTVLPCQQNDAEKRLMVIIADLSEQGQFIRLLAHQRNELRLLRRDLTELNEQLEERVQKRTVELEETNRRLTDEIAERAQIEQERQRLLDRLGEQAQQMQQIIATVPEGVLLLNAEHKVILANPAAQAYLIILSDQEYDPLVALGKFKLDTLLTKSAEKRWHTIQMAQYTFEVIAQPISIVPDIEGWVLVIRDMTQEHDMQQRIRQQDRLAVIGQLAGGVAHDFNNILTAIHGYTDLVLADLVPGDPIRADLQEVKKAATRAEALTRQLLIFSRKQVLQPQVLDLNALISNMEKMLRRLIGEDIEFDTALAPTLPPILADPGQIEQVVMNLSINARDAMPRGGKLVIETGNVNIDHHSEIAPGEYVALTVIDTGTGMTPEVQAHIFEPFFTTKEKGKGTGLGLSTVHGIVKQSDGYIEVDSELGRGTTFHIYLPRTEMSVPADVYQRPSQTSLRGTETILIVEDEDTVRELAQRILEQQGYNVLTARRPSHATPLCAQYGSAISLLITDVVMPEISGQELVRRLKGSCPGMKILYISGYTDDTIDRHSLSNDNATFLEKPFSPTELARQVRQILDRPPVNSRHSV